MNTDSGERERSSERSDVGRSVSSHRLRNGCTSPTRDVVFKEYNDLACGACGRRSMPPGVPGMLDSSEVHVPCPG